MAVPSKRPVLTRKDQDIASSTFAGDGRFRVTKRLTKGTAEKQTLRRSSRLCQKATVDPPSQNPRKRRLDTDGIYEGSKAPGKRARRTSSVERAAKDPIHYWTITHQWPRAHFDTDMSRILARQKSSASLRKKRSVASDSPSAQSSAGSYITPSDQRPRELKSIPYQYQRYETLLATKGSFMNPSSLGITEESKRSYMSLLQTNQTPPEGTLFRDSVFDRTCENVRNRNEARVIQDISRLVVPSPEHLAADGAQHLDILIDSVDAGWNNSIPLTATRPRPDFSVGFRREAFSKARLDKLAPFIGDFISGDLSYFMATYYMYFPFLACEVKCGNTGLDVADRQNAHSMTLAVRAIVEIFRLVGREAEIHRKILAFSVSHDYGNVRIFGHYPIIKGKDTGYYRHPIHAYNLTTLDGRDRWTGYQFTKNVYDTWMPKHFDQLCSAIDEIPENLDFRISSPLQSVGILQDPDHHAFSEPSEHSRQSISAGATPDTSFTQGAKRTRKS